MLMRYLCTDRYLESSEVDVKGRRIGSEMSFQNQNVSLEENDGNFSSLIITFLVSCQTFEALI